MSECDLLILCIDIIIANVSDEYSRLEVLGMNDIITMGHMVVEKYKSEVGQNFYILFG